jgi:Mg2+ and Co2+ transporter CorA
MPWVKQPWGVVAATLLMIGLSAGAFMFFKRRDWL